MATNKEKVDIRRSDQFQEVDDELTRAMAELDSTIERVSLIFEAGDDLPGLEDEQAGAVAAEHGEEAESNTAQLPAKDASTAKGGQ